MDYIITTRRKKRDEDCFVGEPGPVRYLRVPDNVKLPKPSHSVEKDGEEDKEKVKEWINEVLKDCMPGADPSADHPHGDILIFIHGYNNNLKVVMWRHRRIREGLEKEGFNGTVISFDWPSESSALNYLEDRQDARLTALRLVTHGIRPLTARQKNGCEVNVHLLAHSTGAFVVREAFDDADDHKSLAHVNWTVSQIAFIGADVSSKSMSRHDSKSSSIYRHCIRLTNYTNKYDKVLKLSNIKRVGVAPRVGRVGLPDDASSKAVDIDCSDYFHRARKPSSQDDFKGTWEHSWHLSKKRFYEDLYHTLRGDVDRHMIPTRKTVSRNQLKLRK
jgi:esterase/lipase superfamily enzyme